MRRKKVLILGSTGSIGNSALEVIRQHPDLFEVWGLVAGQNSKVLAHQVQEFAPKFVAMAGKESADDLVQRLGSKHSAQVLFGERAIEDLSAHEEVDVVLVAIVGSAGMGPVLSAVRAGKHVALANKESLVAAGALIAKAQKESGAQIIPVDSEHSAIFQALQGVAIEEVRSIILTASGGPFLSLPKEKFAEVTPEQAVKHPRWNMGAKISVDSASLVNKALELIEAYWLFGVGPERIEVVIHPQSIVHSAIRLCDGTLLPQLSVPDMKGPIAYAMTYPGCRLSNVMANLDLSACSPLEFYPLDDDKFPALNLAREALGRGGISPAVFNYANEVAVSLFLSHRIRFDGILPIIRESLGRFDGCSYSSIQDILSIQDETRAVIETQISVPFQK